jgi:hypothetical protein
MPGTIRAQSWLGPSEFYLLVLVDDPMRGETAACPVAFAGSNGAPTEAKSVRRASGLAEDSERDIRTIRCQ